MCYNSAYNSFGVMKVVIPVEFNGALFGFEVPNDTLAFPVDSREQYEGGGRSGRHHFTEHIPSPTC